MMDEFNHKKKGYMGVSYCFHSSVWIIIFVKYDRVDLIQ